MFLPEPKKPQMVLPSLVIYNLYPTRNKVRVNEEFTNYYGKKDTRRVDKQEMAYVNLVMPHKQAEAYRRSSERTINFGTDMYINRDIATVKYHNFYGRGEFGGIHLTNVIAWHNEVFVGGNPETASIVIGDGSVLVKAMESMLKYITDIPYLMEQVPTIIEKAKGKQINNANSNLWDCPIWYISGKHHGWEKYFL